MYKNKKRSISKNFSFVVTIENNPSTVNVSWCTNDSEHMKWQKSQ